MVYSVACLVLKAYIQDCIDLVIEAVKKRITKLDKSGDQKAKKNSERLKRDLKKWTALVDPLAYCAGGKNGGHSALNLVI